MAWSFETESDRVAAIDDSGTSLTRGQIAELTRELAGVLGGRQLVACLCSNTLGSLAGYAAFIENRTVPLLLSAALDHGLLRRLTDHYRPAFVWAPEALVAPLHDAGIAAGSPMLAKVGHVLLRTAHDPVAMHDDLAALLSTSGSTGSPHFVRVSYENLHANAASIVEYLGIGADERPITTLPMEYSYGLSIINSHLMARATILVTNRSVVEKEFWAFLKRESATSVAGVPYTWGMLKRLRFTTMDLPSVRTLTQAGGRLAPALHKELAEHASATGRRLFVMYGQTEATARMSYLPPERTLEKCGSIGVAIPGGTFSLRDGELVYAGPNVTLGYAHSHDDLRKGDENGGVLATGDMAHCDADGFYYIAGRKKRFIKVFGNRVSLDELEQLLASQFAGLECACVGRDDQVTIVVTNGDLAADLKRFVAAKTGLHPTAFVVRTVPAIPTSGAGKTLYSELEKSLG